MLSTTDNLQAYQSLAGGRQHRFAFPVTWLSLTAALELDESVIHEIPAHEVPAAQEVAIESLALELVSAPAPPPPPPSASGRWEMMVPRMVRTRDKTFEPLREVRPSAPPPPDPRLLPPPLFASFQTQSWVSRALSMFDRRAPRAAAQPLLPVLARREPPRPQPVVSPEEMEARRVAREVLLSKIAAALRGKPARESQGDRR